jgi:hypothetical protein
MFRFHLENMVDGLIKNGLIKPHFRTEAINTLSLKWVNKIALVWGTEDIEAVAKDSNIPMKHNEARLALGYLHHKHDCSQGVTWDIIEATIRAKPYLYEERHRRMYD